MRFTPGQVILRRYRRDGRYTWVQPLHVVSDDPTGLLLWHPVGSEFARLVDAEGANLHDVPLDRMRAPRLETTRFRGYDILVLMPPRAAYSVWWFFDRGAFSGWYVNLEDPYVRRRDSVDTVDHVLDIWVTPDRAWQWKDEDEFATHTGHPMYFDAQTALDIRAEGERLIELVEKAEFPFDGSYTDFRPDPTWSTLRMPNGWDREHPATGAAG